MNSIVDVGDSSQSPRGPRTPWSPVRVNRPHRGLSPVAPPNSDPSSFHAVLADTSSRVDVTGSNAIGVPLTQTLGLTQIEVISYKNSSNGVHKNTSIVTYVTSV